MHPSSRVMASALPAAFCVLLAACFDFDATMAGGAPAVSSEDAGAVDGSKTELGDATVMGGDDAGMVGDAGPDAPSFVGDGGPFCASLTPPDAGPYFCEDFDDDPLPGSWNSVGETGGTLTETDAGAVSRPNSLDLATSPAATGAVVDVALRTTLGVPTVPATLRFSFDVDPLEIDVTSASAIVLGALDFLDAAGNRYTLGLAINVTSGAPALTLGEQTAYADGGVLYVNHPLLPTEPLAMSQWSAVVLEIDWTASTSAEALVLINGAKELDVKSLTIPLQASSLQIGVGTSYVSEPATPWELRYDDVLFTTSAN